MADSQSLYPLLGAQVSDPPLAEDTELLVMRDAEKAIEDEERRKELEKVALASPSAISQKRCKRFGCGAFYSDATNGECIYHTQEFRPMVSMRQGTQVGWMCCRVTEWLQMNGVAAHPVINEAALKKNYPGCTRAPLHLEDEVYTRCVAQFPLNPQAALEAAVANARPRPQVEVPELDPSDPNSEARIKEFNDANAGLLPYTLYKITSIDTLQGVALRFNIPVVTIQRLNRLHNQQIQHLKYIRIPKSEEEVAKITELMASKNTQAEEMAALRSAAAQEKIKIQMFRRQTGVHSNEEAKYYMNECEGDVDGAIKMCKEDLAWEEQNKHLSPEARAEAERKDLARLKRRQSCFCFASAFDPLDD